MTVEELIEELNKIKNKKAQVIMSKNSEGNNFSPFSDVIEDVRYHAETTWRGDIYIKEYHDEAEWEDIVATTDSVECIVLYPN